ncbi:hypothetical protein KAT24_01090 [Candidatus Pacearchaeota archaeon]|nr:hypothetical protein [Candidatus Pacearchaeota archaeon]
MKKGVWMIVIICGVLFLVAITIILFLNLNHSSEKPFTIVSKEECISEGEKCMKLEYNENFSCEDFSGSDYNLCMSIYSYFNENLGLCTEIKSVSDDKMIIVCFAISNYCLDEKDKNFKFYEKVININKYLELCGK